MTKTVKDLNFETLARLALVASGVVRADAVRRGVTLPIWRDGKVLFAHPATGEIFTSEPPPSPPDATRDQQTTLDRNDEERLDALRALGIVLPFDATKTKATRADND